MTVITALSPFPSGWPLLALHPDSPSDRGGLLRLRALPHRADRASWTASPPPLAGTPARPCAGVPWWRLSRRWAWSWGGIGWAGSKGSARGLETGRAPPAGCDGTTGTDAVFRSLRSNPAELDRRRGPRHGGVPRAGSPRTRRSSLVGGIELGRRVAALPGFGRHRALSHHRFPDYPIRARARLLEGLGLLKAGPRLRAAASIWWPRWVSGSTISSRGATWRATVFSSWDRASARQRSSSPEEWTPGPPGDRRLRGGDIGSLVTHVSGRGARPVSPWQAAVAGTGLALLLAPLEPTRYIGPHRAAARVDVNGARDSLIARANVDAL